MTEQNISDMSQHFFRASAADFMKVPGSPVAYWVSKELRSCFSELPLVSQSASPVCGMTTGENAKFVREWFEVSQNLFSSTISTAEQALESGLRWFPYAKGGQFRKWYGNAESVVDWENDGERIISSGRASPRAKANYFRPSVSWSFISSSYFGARQQPAGFIFDMAGCSLFPENPNELAFYTAIMCSKTSSIFLKTINPTLNYQVNNVGSIPVPVNINYENVIKSSKRCVQFSKSDWDSYEYSWDFTSPALLTKNEKQPQIYKNYINVRSQWLVATQNMQRLEEENNRIFIEAYGLQNELTPEVPLNEITLTCNPHYRYGGDLTEQEREDRLQSDTIAELVSYAIGCMMGRYSLDKEGLILASQGETIQDYLAHIPNPRFMPDEDAIIPLTDEEWFPDDATNLVRDFIRTVWGEETLQENLDFVAESLCLHAIRARKSETALEAIRRYLSTQFYKNHMRTYKKRPIYWLFSSGKQKAFECLVYLHRYNESTLSRMRTEYVTQLMGKYESQINHLEEQVTQASTSEKTKLNRALRDYHAKLNELREFDNKLKHYADMRIALDLDDGVKENYGKFGDLLANVRDITGKKPKVS